MLVLEAIHFHFHNFIGACWFIVATLGLRRFVYVCMYVCMLTFSGWGGAVTTAMAMERSSRMRWSGLIRWREEVRRDGPVNVCYAGQAGREAAYIP